MKKLVLVLALVASASAFADDSGGGPNLPTGHGHYQNGGSPSQPQCCPAGFEPKYDIGYGKWTCVIAPDPNQGGNGGSNGA